MHSRIIQLSFFPINEDEYVTEDAWELESFIGSIADYVADSPDRQEDIDWFISCIGPDHVECDGNMIIFLPEFKEGYFKPRLEKLKQTVQELTLEQFANYSLINYDIRRFVVDEYGFYVLIDKCWMPFDDFVRELEEGVPYYIGATLDYHY